MKIGIKPAFSFKPRLPNSIKVDYDAIITDILIKNQPCHEAKSILSSKTYSTTPSYAFKANLKREAHQEENKPKYVPEPKATHFQSESFINYKLTTTKYVTAYKKSFLIPTVIAVISKSDKTVRFEKKTTLSEKRNRHLIEKKLFSASLKMLDEKKRDKDNSVSAFDINSISEELRDMSVVNKHQNSEDLSKVLKTPLLKSPSNLINQIRSRIKKGKTSKV